MALIHVISARFKSSGLAALVLLTTVLIAGCASNTRARGLNDANNGDWTGRISLQVASEPPQVFIAGFELKGRAEQGELTLTTPIGNVLGVLKWSPAEATLQSGGNTQRFDSVDALLESTTGAALPVQALFDWLAGQNTRQSGWSADLSQHRDGKIDAVRTEPLPFAKLRIVLAQ